MDDVAKNLGTGLEEEEEEEEEMYPADKVKVNESPPKEMGACKATSKVKVLELCTVEDSRGDTFSKRARPGLDHRAFTFPPTGSI